MSKAKANKIIVIPQTVEALHALIAEHQDRLSARLKVVAAWIIEHPQQIPLSTLAEIAAAAGVHASTLVRFANYFSFDGFSELQKLYKTRMLDNPSNYRERISELKRSTAGTDTTATGLLEEFAEGNLLGLELLREQIKPDTLDAAIQTLNQAKEVYVCGLRRMYPVATYFHYALSHLDIRCHLVDGNGAMEQEQISWAGPNSVLIAITFYPYTPVVAEVVRTAVARGCKVVLLTDSELCPIAKLADHLFVIQEAEVRTFRSLNSTLCLAQTLCVALGYQRQEEKS